MRIQWLTMIICFLIFFIALISSNLNEKSGASVFERMFTFEEKPEPIYGRFCRVMYFYKPLPEDVDMEVGQECQIRHPSGRVSVGQVVERAV